MKNLEWTTIDKSSWKSGPWQSEPDKKQWTDLETGYPCLIVRNTRHGNLCGYVGVTKPHPLYGADSGSESMKRLSVHGGVNFTNKCQPSESESKGVCHVVNHDEDDDVWWVGFDCAHWSDLVPRMPMPYLLELDLFDNCTYKNVQYVETECCDLAKQLKTLEKA